MAWTIKGEAGATLNQTARTPEQLLVERLTARFTWLDVDTMTWSSATENIAAGGTIIPSFGQQVELWEDSVRRFAGVVTDVKVLTSSVQVVASGPQWWMKQTPLTSLPADSTGQTSERVSYVFPTQDLATSIEALINRANALGCPIEMGNIVEMFICPKITLDEKDCFSALAALLRWVPDSAGYVDYAPDVPTMHITRRTPARVLNFSATTDNVETIEIRPRLDLEVKQTSLKYVVREATTGRPRWASQSHGTNTTGKRQIFTISGPEIETRLPKDDFDSYAVRTTEDSTYIQNHEPTLQAVKENYTVDVGITSGSTYSLYRETRNGAVDISAGEHTWGSPAIAKQRNPGEPSWQGAMYVMTTAAPPDWVKKLPGITIASGTIAGSYIYFRNTELVGSRPAWVRELGMDQVLAGYNGSAEYCEYLAKPFSMACTFISDPYSSLTTLYKPWDYDFLTPPAGLAQNLQDAQDWVPWEGTFVRVVDEVSAASNILGRKINLTNTLPVCASMGALMKAVTYEIQRGTIIYELGSPARSDYGSLVAKIRREPKDNIEYIT